jgi:DNA-repair protein XRCC1
MILTGDVVYAQLTLKDLFQDIKRVVEQWSFVPHVVNELLKLDERKKEAALPKDQLSQLSTKCKKIY